MFETNLKEQISEEVRYAFEIYVDNLDTIKLRTEEKRPSIEDFITDVITLSTALGFYISDERIKDQLVRLLNLTDGIYTQQDNSDEGDFPHIPTLKRKTSEVFEHLQLKYAHFNEIKPKHIDAFKESITVEEPSKLAKKVRSEFYTGSKRVDKKLARNMFPTEAALKNASTDLPYILIYIGCVVSYCNIRYNLEARSIAAKLDIN